MITMVRKLPFLRMDFQFRETPINSMVWPLNRQSPNSQLCKCTYSNCDDKSRPSRLSVLYLYNYHNNQVYCGVACYAVPWAFSFTAITVMNVLQWLCGCTISCRGQFTVIHDNVEHCWPAKSFTE